MTGRSSLFFVSLWSVQPDAYHTQVPPSPEVRKYSGGRRSTSPTLLNIRPSIAAYPSSKGNECVDDGIESVRPDWIKDTQSHFQNSVAGGDRDSYRRLFGVDLTFPGAVGEEEEEEEGREEHGGLTSKRPSWLASDDQMPPPITTEISQRPNWISVPSQVSSPEGPTWILDTADNRQSAAVAVASVDMSASAAEESGYSSTGGRSGASGGRRRRPSEPMSSDVASQGSQGSRAKSRSSGRSARSGGSGGSSSSKSNDRIRCIHDEVQYLLRILSNIAGCF